MTNTRLIERNKVIIKLYITGKFTLQDLATKYNISRERVRQIADPSGTIRTTNFTERKINKAKAKEAKNRFDREVRHAKIHAIMQDWNTDLDRHVIAKTHGYKNYNSLATSINNWRSEGYKFKIRWEPTASESTIEAMKNDY